MYLLGGILFVIQIFMLVSQVVIIIVFQQYPLVFFFIVKRLMNVFFECKEHLSNWVTIVFLNCMCMNQIIFHYKD